jgi:hypothetical protein
MTKHIHYDTIKAWANGATIEIYDLYKDTWHAMDNPSWYEDNEYRIKPQPKPDLVREALIVNSLSAGPMLYAASPSESNIVLLFDGETGKLKQCTIKGA